MSRLPPQLERDIFTLAALADPIRAPRLLLLAHRVKTWVEPIVYRSVLVRPNHYTPDTPIRADICFVSWSIPAFTFEFLRGILTRNPSLARSVRNVLVFEGHPDDIGWLFRTCTEISEMMYLSQAVVYHHLFQLAPGSLRRLRGNIHHLLGNDVYKHMRLHSSLINLTHLEIQDNAEPLSDILLSVLCLPAITHISLWVLKAERMAAQIAPHAQTIVDALAPTGPVHAFALVQSFNRLGEIAVDHGFTLPDTLKSHYRFVLWPGDIHDATTNWLNGARMEGDFWDQLDRCVDFQWRSYYWRAKKREEQKLEAGADV